MLPHEIDRVFNRDSKRHGYKLLRAALLVVHDLSCADFDPRLEELIFTHPIIVVDLAEISSAGIWNDDNDEIVLCQFLGRLQGRIQCGTGGAACKNSFVTG